jgi:hypothetical protein
LIPLLYQDSEVSDELHPQRFFAIPELNLFQLHSSLCMPIKSYLFEMCTFVHYLFAIEFMAQREAAQATVALAPYRFRLTIQSLLVHSAPPLSRKAGLRRVFDILQTLS